MTSNRPYLLRAVHEWIVDNQLTPYLLVDATRSGVRVPAHAVKDGKIVLNLAAQAVSAMELGNEFVRLHARFGGVPELVEIPLSAVSAIYAQENGQGLAFADDESAPQPPADGSPPTAAPTPPTRGAGSHLRVVK